MHKLWGNLQLLLPLLPLLMFAQCALNYMQLIYDTRLSVVVAVLVGVSGLTFTYNSCFYFLLFSCLTFYLPFGNARFKPNCTIARSCSSYARWQLVLFAAAFCYCFN